LRIAVETQHSPENDASTSTSSSLSVRSHRPEAVSFGGAKNERRNKMKKYMLLYKGPATPPGASHEKWPVWFNKIGENLVSIGSPINQGFVLHSDGSKDNSATNFNGYSIIQAKNINTVKNLVKDHPFLSLGTAEYSVEIFELAR
jgi:hypothetical protein